MDEEYWDNLADEYEAEVFDVLGNDREQAIRSHIRRRGGKAKTAVDFGCGIGRFLPVLSENFGKVIAVDISRKLLARAEKACSGLGNVEFRQFDMASKRVPIPKAHFALCVNSLLAPSLSQRLAFFRTISRGTLVGGYLVLVVPSLESALFTQYRLIQWNLRTGLSPAAAVRSGFQDKHEIDAKRLRQGIVATGDEPTKHYLREELLDLLASHKLCAQDLTKLEYPWKTEFPSPPRWMADPFPWDWLAVAQRRR